MLRRWLLSLCLAALLALPLISAMGQTASGRRLPFYILTDTLSPRKQYALAWAVRGRSDVDYAALHAEENSDRMEDLLKDEDAIENFVVDAKAGRILARIPPLYRTITVPGEARPTRYKAGGGYWAGGGMHPNHNSLQTQWLPDESLAVVVYDSKWEYDAIYLLEKRGAGFRTAEIGQGIEKYVRNYLKLRYEAAYREASRMDPRNPVIEVEEMKLTPAALAMEVTASVPKDEEGKYLNFAGTLRMVLIRQGSTLGVRILSLTRHANP